MSVERVRRALTGISGVHVTPYDSSGAIPVTDGAGCRGAHCDAFVAIECNR